LKTALRITGFALLLLFIGAQFFRPARNDGVADGTKSLVKHEEVPPEVHAILKRSCYDCHSDRTVYPWYAAVQPVAWWLNQHVADGKRELNFSQFAEYDVRHAVQKLQAVADEVHERHMPLKSYLIAHREAKLSDADVALLMKWAEDLADDIDSR
jgi:hypothetical protein